MSVLSLSRPALHRRASLAARVSEWLALKRSRAALARLDDHMLADIGLTRDYAQNEAQRPFWQQ